ncbi:MAG TPA: hypothetical protein VIK99_10525 [Thermaerobacter sp.]
MSVGPIDGSHALQSAAEAQRVRVQADESARGQDQAQRFAAALQEARRRHQVTAPGAGGEAGRAEAWRPGVGEGGGRGTDTDGPRQRRRRGGPAGTAGAASPGRGETDEPAEPDFPAPVPEDVPAKGLRLDVRG